MIAASTTGPFRRIAKDRQFDDQVAAPPRFLVPTLPSGNAVFDTQRRCGESEGMRMVLTRSVGEVCSHAGAWEQGNRQGPPVRRPGRGTAEGSRSHAGAWEQGKYDRVPIAMVLVPAARRTARPRGSRVGMPSSTLRVRTRRRVLRIGYAAAECSSWRSEVGRDTCIKYPFAFSLPLARGLGSIEHPVRASTIPRWNHALENGMFLSTLPARRPWR